MEAEVYSRRAKNYMLWTWVGVMVFLIGVMIALAVL